MRTLCAALHNFILFVTATAKMSMCVFAYKVLVQHECV